MLSIFGSVSTADICDICVLRREKKLLFNHNLTQSRPIGSDWIRMKIQLGPSTTARYRSLDEAAVSREKKKNFIAAPHLRPKCWLGFNEFSSAVDSNSEKADP